MIYMLTSQKTKVAVLSNILKIQNIKTKKKQSIFRHQNSVHIHFHTKFKFDVTLGFPSFLHKS
jgi:peptide methionine sulfoxide reductase MsrB